MAKITIIARGNEGKKMETKVELIEKFLGFVFHCKKYISKKFQKKISSIAAKYDILTPVPTVSEKL